MSEKTATMMKNLIKDAGLTQDGFAAKYGIPKNTVHNWCQGVNEPPAYLVDLIWKDATVGNSFRAAWVVEEYRDSTGTGSQEFYSSRASAVRVARDRWDRMNERERQSYREPGAIFDVVLYAMTWDEIGMEWITDGDPEVVAIDFTK